MADKNQDKNQSKNRAEQAEEHDESVLNPEIKNESDLSKKERRLIEKEKLKGMGPKKKLEYIWMYYKPAIFGVIAVIALIFGIKDYYEQSKIKTVLSMTVVNSMANDTETPEQKIKETLGYKDDPYSKWQNLIIMHRWLIWHRSRQVPLILWLCRRSFIRL